MAPVFAPTVGDRQSGLQLSLARQRAWLKRSACSQKQREPWRPAKRHRLSAQKWVAMNDRQLAVCTSFGGLSFLQPTNAETWAPEAWKSWPWASVTLDQGSDGLAGVHACLYKESLRLNLSVWYDWSHGCCRDLEGAYRQVGKFQFMLMMLVPMNIPHGPEKDEGMRYEQLSAAWRHMLSTYEPSSFELWQSFAGRILDDAADNIQLPGVAAATEELWHWLKHDDVAWPPKGHRIKLCEYMAWIRGAERFLRDWSKMQFLCEFISLEMDMFVGSAFREHLLVPSSAARMATDTQTTNSGITQIDQKILRSACQNAVVATWAITNTTGYKRQLAIMVHIPMPLAHWQGQAAQDLRSCVENQAWLKRQFQSGFAEHLLAIMDTLSDSQCLRSCGFFEFEGVAEGDEKNGVVLLDDEYAALAGMLALALLSARCRRLAYCWIGWPGRFCKMMCGPSAAAQAAAEFQEDHQAYMHMAAIQRPGAALQRLLGRSVFRTTPVKQFVAAFEATTSGPASWSPPHDAIVSLVVGRGRFMISSSIVEEVHNFQKNSGQARGSKRFRRPQRSMAIAWARKVVAVRHAYQQVEPSVPVARRNMKLTGACFGQQPSKPSLDLGGISSASAQAAWFSPSPASVSAPAVDLALFRDAKEQGVTDMNFALLGCFCSAQHLVAVRRIGGKGRRFDWHVGLLHMSGSAIVGWPASVEPAPGAGNASVVTLRRECTDPSVFGIFTWEGLEAVSFCWRSWAWQVSSLPGAVRSWRPALRAVVSLGPAPLLEVAARSAWWQLDLATLQKLSELLCLRAHRQDILFDQVFVMTKAALDGTSDADILDIVAKRLAQPPGDQDDCTADLMAIDEAMQCLEREDMEKLKEAKRTSESRSVARSTFSSDYRAKRAQVSAAAGKRKTDKKRAASSSSSVRRRVPPDVHMLEQREAKKLMPPSGALWKRRGDVSWHTKVGDFATCNRSAAKHGERALLLCLSDAWHKWCLLNGVDLKDCPMEGLLTEEEVAQGCAR